MSVKPAAQRQCDLRGPFHQHLVKPAEEAKAIEAGVTCEGYFTSLPGMPTLAKMALLDANSNK